MDDNMSTKIKAVIFDWAGTVVDYGCFAPIHALDKAFAEKEVKVTTEEVREPMGLLKRDHIIEILKMKRVQEVWQDKYNRTPNEADIDSLYQSFEKNLFEVLHQFAEPLPGVIDVVYELKQQNIKVGSTSGYTRKMMNVVARHARNNGYAPDYIVTADEVEKGRPAPNMIFENMKKLDVYPPSRVVKVGDTVSDIKAGKNAGVWSVGVIKGSSELALTEQEVNQLSEEAYEKHAALVTDRYNEAGADYVIENIAELPTVLKQIESTLEGKNV